MNDLPKFSIITPSYNQGQYLERTILSVINQNYSNVEHIIIDGGSTDSTLAVLEKYRDQLAFSISEKDNGTFDANNKALSKITGDYWCVVNSDDVLLPNALNTVAQEISNNWGVMWLCGGEIHINENDEMIGKHMPERPNNTIDGFTFLDGCWISHPTVFLHKDVINIVGLFKKYHLMDLNYWLRLEKEGFKPHIINAYIAGLRIHADCKSADRIKLTEEFLRVVSDFSRDNKISENTNVKKAYTQSRIYLFKLMLSNDLARRNRGASLKNLMSIVGLDRSNLFTRWYWGAIKRVFLISPNDPIFKEFPEIKSNANWN